MGISYLPQHAKLAEQLGLKKEELQLENETLTDRSKIKVNDKKIFNIESILRAYDEDLKKQAGK